MRLLDLSPRWLYKDGARVGFIFVCPTRSTEMQTCFSIAMNRKDQSDCVKRLLGEEVFKDNAHHIQLCNKECAWTIQGEFNNLTCTPSLDGSLGGNWHGFITNGEIIGGL